MSPKDTKKIKRKDICLRVPCSYYTKELKTLEDLDSYNEILIRRIAKPDYKLDNI